MKKGYLALLMALIMIASCTVIAIPEASAADTHDNTHCICGGKCEGVGDHKQCTDVTWSAASSSKPTGGYVYLTGNTTWSSINLTSDLYLCLNGYKIETGNARVFYQSTTGTFKLNICDCSEEGSGTVRNTSASTSTAGGIFASSTSSRKVNITLWGGTYQQASSNRANGGLFHLQYGSTLTVYNAKMTGGVATGAGGAIWAAGSNSTVTIYSGEFYGCSANNGGFIYANAALNIYGGNFYQNSATTDGGQIYATGLTTITGGTFTGGSAVNGGVMHLRNATVSGATISGGNASGDGDNIYIGSAYTGVVSGVESSTVSGAVVVMDVNKTILKPSIAGMGFQVEVAGSTVTEYGVKLTVEGDVNGGYTEKLGAAAGVETLWLKDLYVAGHTDAKVTVQVYAKIGDAEYTSHVYTTSMKDLITKAAAMDDLTPAQSAALQALQGVANQ